MQYDTDWRGYRLASERLRGRVEGAFYGALAGFTVGTLLALWWPV